jgi:hypothetical protein
MSLLDACLRVPTVFFTVGLGIAMVYWLFVLLGALDIDLLGGGDAAGAGKGLGDALVGSKGGAEGIKPDLQGHGVWEALGLSSVPITISVTAALLVGWTLSVLGMHYGAGALGVGTGWLAALVVFVAIVIGVPLAGLLVRPLAPVFKVRTGKSNRDYVGATCTITTGSVDDGFGQATIEDGGTVLVIAVRCDRPDALGRGARALIIDFDTARQAYVVEPTDA